MPFWTYSSVNLLRIISVDRTVAVNFPIWLVAFIMIWIFIGIESDLTLCSIDWTSWDVGTPWNVEILMMGYRLWILRSILVNIKIIYLYWGKTWSFFSDGTFTLSMLKGRIVVNIDWIISGGIRWNLTDLTYLWKMWNIRYLWNLRYFHSIVIV